MGQEGCRALSCQRERDLGSQDPHQGPTGSTLGSATRVGSALEVGPTSPVPVPTHVLATRGVSPLSRPYYPGCSCLQKARVAEEAEQGEEGWTVTVAPG